MNRDDDRILTAEERAAEYGEQLLTRAGWMLHTLSQAGFDPLHEPIDLLSLQLLGPVLARAIGDEPRRSMDTILKIVDLIDIETVRRTLADRTATVDHAGKDSDERR